MVSPLIQNLYKLYLFSIGIQAIEHRIDILISTLSSCQCDMQILRTPMQIRSVQSIIEWNSIKYKLITDEFTFDFGQIEFYCAKI